MSSSLGSSGSGEKVNQTPAVETKSGLTDIFNQGIVKMEQVSRPLDSGSASSAIADAIGVEHGGVKATTTSGDQYLIHKGDGFGKAGGNTVVVPAEEMSGKWHVRG